jgi:hypothetical protein
MLSPNPNYVRDRACSDPNGPIDCIADEEVVTQHSFTGQYRDAPRIERELSLSVFRGQVSARDATSYIRIGKPVEEWEKRKIRVRYLHVGRLREAGLAVVHTPGRVAYPEHCSVVWPADDPLNSQDAAWPPEIREGFNACFTGEEEGWEE